MHKVCRITVFITLPLLFVGFGYIFPLKELNAILTQIVKGRQESSSKELNQLRVHVEAQKQSLTSLHTAYKELVILGDVEIVKL